MLCSFSEWYILSIFIYLNFQDYQENEGLLKDSY